MKKLRISIILGLVVLAFGMLVACGAPSLSKPKNVQINNKTITWEAVENARGYTVQIAGVKHDVRRTTYNFENVRLEEGTYTIKVKARGNEVDYADSAWATIEYVQGYESGIVYELNENGNAYVVKSVGTAKGDIVIEDMYNELPVEAVGNYAFTNNLDVKSVVLGKNITSIGSRAFYGCTGMTSVTIPEGVTAIGEMAFQSCHSLGSVTIPDSVTVLGNAAFAYCKTLTDVYVGSGVKSIGDGAFKNCAELRAITIPANVDKIGQEAFRNNTSLASVEVKSRKLTVGEAAFRGCASLGTVNLGNCETALSDYMFGDCAKIASIMIPDNVTAVGNNTFANCTSLADITIGDGVTAIGQNAFYNTAAINGLTDKVYVVDGWIVGTSNSNLSVETLITSDDIFNLYEDDIIGIADYAFNSCLLVRQAVLPKSVKYLGRGAFYRCTSLYYVIAGDELVSVGQGAFIYCTALMQVRLGAKVQSIGSYAFAYCENLDCSAEKFFMPDTVTSIGTYAFYKTALWAQAETLGEVGSETDGLMYVGSWLVGCTQKKSGTVDVAEDVIGIADYAFAYCSGIHGVKLPDGLMYLGEGAFYGCVSQTEWMGLPATVMFGVNIPDGITEIKPFTFYGVPMGRIDLPDSVKKIGYSAFGGSGLGEIIIPDSVTEIDSFAFWCCTYLEKVELSKNITEIADRAFSGCTSLQSITIPSKVTSIGERAFFRCNALTEVVFEGDVVDTIGDKAFYMCAMLKSITLPDSVATVGNYAFYKCYRLSNIDFNSRLQSIGDYAFYDCQSLTGVVLPDSVTAIGSSAFRYCKGLKQIVIGRYVTEIGEHAFYGDKALTIYGESPVLPSGWATDWNSSYRPVVLGCTLDGEKIYIASVEKTDTFMYNSIAEGGISAPIRDGYVFVGWATEAGGEPQYTAANISQAPNGTLYSVWQEHVEPEPEAPDVTE